MLSVCVNLLPVHTYQVKLRELQTGSGIFGSEADNSFKLFLRASQSGSWYSYEDAMFGSPGVDRGGSIPIESCPLNRSEKHLSRKIRAHHI